jgi:hypothetical protein
MLYPLSYEGARAGTWYEGGYELSTFRDESSES